MRYPNVVRSCQLVLALIFTLLPAAQESVAGAGTADVVIAGERFELEVALDPASRSRGLMFREEIPVDGGMLFVFPNNAPRNFWMKNCLVDMDILFLDENRVVTTVKQMFAEPLRGQQETVVDYHARLPRYASDGRARFAIELKYGSAARLGVAPGDRVEFDSESLVRRAR